MVYSSDEWMRVGSDYDGCTENIILTRPKYIITGRSVYQKEELYSHMEKLGLNPNDFSIHMYPGKTPTSMGAALFKAETINKLKLVKFYEDHPLIAFFLREHCTDTTIVNIRCHEYHDDFIEETFKDTYSYKTLMRKAY